MNLSFVSGIRRPSVWLAFVALTLALAISYRSTADWMVDRFSAPDSHYGHGWIIPVLSLFLLWRNLGGKVLNHRPCLISGFGLLIFGGLVHLASVLLRVHFTSGFSFPIVLLGLTLVFSGRDLFRVAFFPIVFLGFMVPLPLVSLAQLSLTLKLLATRLGATLLVWLGTDVTARGSELVFPGDKLIVGSACSGLRSMISLVSFGVLFAAISSVGWLRKGILVAATVPIAVVANASRLVVLGLVTAKWGSDSIHGLVHDLPGLLIYVVAFIGLFGLEFLLRRIPGTVRRVSFSREVADADGPGFLEAVLRSPLSRGGGLAALLVLFGLGFSTIRLEAGSPQERLSAAIEVPMRFGEWVGQDVEVHESTYRQLETRDVVFRDYLFPGSRIVNLCVVFGGENRKTAHPPEVCYRGSGREIAAKERVSIPGWNSENGREEGFSAHRLHIVGDGHDRCTLYWYAIGPRFVPDYLSHQWQTAMSALRGKDPRSAMVRISVEIESWEEWDRATEYLQHFAQVVSPSIRRAID